MIYCNNCKSQISEKVNFCSICGHQVGQQTTQRNYNPSQSFQPPYPQYPEHNQSPEYKLAVQYIEQKEAKEHESNAKIAGIVGLFFMGFILGPLAIYYGKKAKKIDPTKGTSSIVLGVLDIFMIFPIMILISTI